MIWQSITLMTMFDVLILGIVGFTAVAFVRDRAKRPTGRSDIGSVAILCGLGLIALFYLGDLVVMHAFPGFMSMEEAMSVMTAMHQNGSWLVVLFGVGSICYGFTAVNRASTAAVAELEARETERREVERSLSETESLLSSIFENIPVGLLIKDSDHVVARANRTYLQWYGLAAETIVGRRSDQVEGFQQSEDAEIMNAQEQEIIASGCTKTRQIERPFSDGRVHTIDITKFPIFDQQNRITKVGSVSVDITEQVKAESRLKESEDRLIQATQLVGLGHWVWDVASDRCIYCSEEHARIHGMSVAEYLSSCATTEGDQALTHVDDRERYNASEERLRNGEEVALEYRIVTPQGETRYIREMSKPVFDEDGRVIQEFGVALDITERKRAEEELRESEARFGTLVEFAPEAITILDADTSLYVDANPRAEALHGRPREELIGKLSPRDLSPEFQPDGRPSTVAAKEYLSRALAGEFPRFEWMHFTPEGEETLCEVSLARLPDPKRNLVRGIIVDITERKAAEARRIELEATLAQAQRLNAVGQLTAGIAHDFNNMLAVIVGNAELLEENAGTENPQVAAIMHASKRAADLTDRLLAFSRKQILAPQVVNANRLISDVSGMLSRILEAHIEIRTVCDAGLWNCTVDPAQLDNALVNLAINARDAMPEGGKLTIETANVRLDDDYAAAQAELTPGQYVMLAISDTGTGMSREVQEHIFEPFFTTKSVGEGSGLGLSMVYGFVKQSGGHVTIYSEPGEGTTVKLYLPRSLEAKVTEPQAAATDMPLAKGETILVVEDDSDLRTLAVALLIGLGYQVAEAANAASALEQLDPPSQVDLILSDVMLSGDMNGPQLASEAKLRGHEIKVLYMSGYADGAIAHHGRVDPGVELLRKPFRRAELAQALRRVLDS